MSKRPRRPAPRLVAQEETVGFLTAAGRSIREWKELIGAAIVVFSVGGAAYAFKDSIVTKAELEKRMSPVTSEMQKHNDELIRIDQALLDIKETVRDIREQVTKTNK